ncbi:MAG: SH3 domain-containing protein [Chloroflexi bacterium]|nr:SH3 domain-containing protein [Chloroflexota bacterium]
MKRWLVVLWLLLMALAAAAQDDDGIVYPAPQYATDETLAVVVYPRVNLRTLPGLDGAVADIAILGDRFPVDGISEDGRWYLVQANGGQAWISSGSVIVTHPERIGEVGLELSPEQRASIDAQVALAQSTLGVRGNLNLRSGPGTGYSLVGRVPQTGRVFVQGRNTYGTWIYVNYNGVQGWVSGLLLAYPPGFLLDSIPVVR